MLIVKRWLIHNSWQVTGESEGLHDDADFNETFCLASDNRASNTSSFEKDQIAEDHVQEKVLSRIATNNQNSGISALYRTFAVGAIREIGEKYTETFQ